MLTKKEIAKLRKLAKTTKNDWHIWDNIHDMLPERVKDPAINVRRPQKHFELWDKYRDLKNKLEKK